MKSLQVVYKTFTGAFMTIEQCSHIYNKHLYLFEHVGVLLHKTDVS